MLLVANQAVGLKAFFTCSAAGASSGILAGVEAAGRRSRTLETANAGASGDALFTAVVGSFFLSHSGVTSALDEANQTPTDFRLGFYSELIPFLLKSAD